MTYNPLHHKYRPQTFAELVGQEAIATTLSHAIISQRIAPAYLFTGPRGTGKTSSARILSKSLNCLGSEQPTPKPCGQCEVCRAIAKGNALDVIEIDAASNTGVDNIREIIERAQFAPVQCRYKVYIIDEVHMLSTAAFNALLKTLEEPPARVVFVLATTDPQRVLPTIISRCQRFDFRRIPIEAMVSHLRMIAEKEAINITEDAIALLAQIAHGGLRDAESLLDQLSLLSYTNETPTPITVEQIWDLVGAVPEQDLLALIEAIATINPEAVLERCRNLIDRGREPLVVLQNLAGFYRDLLIAKTAPQRQDLVAVTAPTWNQLCQSASGWETNTILRGQQHLKDSEVQIKNTTQPRLWLEITLLGLLPAATITKSSDSAPSFQGGVSLTQPIQQSAVSHQSRQIPNQASPHPSAQSQAPSSKDLGSRGAAEQRAGDKGDTGARERWSRGAGEQGSPSVSLGGDLGEPEVNASSPSLEPDLVQPVVENSSDSQQTTEQVWQQVLNQIQPYATQVLLRQHCHLLNFAGSTARVGITSQPLLKLAQNRKANIEAAFETVCHHKVSVSLEVATPTVSSSKPPETTQKPSASKSWQRETTSTNVVTTQKQIGNPSTDPTTPDPTVSPVVPVVEEEDLESAAQSLVECFKGEIVSFYNEPIATSTFLDEEE